ncbi:cytoplasmic alpha-amylase, partial [human gut metagenome]
MCLFDVPLHYNLFNACHSNGHFDMRTIFSNTLVASVPDKAITFVDNHDTEPGQALES